MAVKRTSRKQAASKASNPLQKKLANIGELWGKAKEQARELGNQFISEPMKGLFRLTNASIAEIGRNNWLHVAFEFTCVEEGEYQGQMHTHRSGLQDEQALSFLIRDLQRLGVDTEKLEINSLEDLEAILKELTEVGPTVRARLVESKDNPDFLNMRITGLVEVDDIPFDTETEEDVEGAEEEGEDTVEIGDIVTWKSGGTERTGKVAKVFEDGRVRVVDEDDGKMKTLKAGSFELVQDEEEEEEPAEEADEATEEDEEVEEAAEEEEEEVELQKGMPIVVTYKGKEYETKVMDIDAEAGKVKAKVAGKTLLFPIDKVEVLEG